MSDIAALSSEAVELLLELLELPEPLLSGQAARSYPMPLAQLTAAGLLASHDFEDVTTSLADDDDVPVSLTWSEQAGAPTYFSPAVGPVAVAAEQLLRRSVVIPETLRAIIAGFDILASSPFQLIDSLLWEIGDVRLGRRSAPVSIWFVRRLWDRSVQRQLGERARARPHYRRIVITSSRAARVGDVIIPGVTVVPLRDVQTSPNSLTVSSEILDALLSNVSARAPAGPLTLAQDGTKLSIAGNPPILFTSDNHKGVIRKLVAAHAAGTRFRVGELTKLGSLRRLFGEKRWKLLSPYLTSQNGLWGFDV